MPENFNACNALCRERTAKEQVFCIFFESSKQLKYERIIVRVLIFIGKS